jgi:hypothetical protein
VKSGVPCDKGTEDQKLEITSDLITSSVTSLETTRSRKLKSFRKNFVFEETRVCFFGDSGGEIRYDFPQNE